MNKDQNLQSVLEKGAVQVAKELLGWRLVHDTPRGQISGKVVETEAYTSVDQASHSYKWKTSRTSVMFRPAGFAYVYFTYGMHYCLNVVTGEDGEGEAVLFRALEPLEGIENMMANRHKDNITQLTNGPAKLFQALGLTKDYYGVDLRRGTLRLEPPLEAVGRITQTTRIGITKDVHRPWRFYVTDNPFVSKS